MKKILLALAIFTSVQVADAQVKSAADAKKAVEAAEAAAKMKRRPSRSLHGSSSVRSM